MNSEYPTTPLRRIGQVVGGSTPTPDEDNWDGGIPFVTPPDLRPVHGGVVRETERTLSELGVKSGSTIVPPGSVVLSIRAPIGYVARIVEPVAFNQGCRAIVPGGETDPRFLTYALVAAAVELESIGRGTTFTEVSGSQLSAFEVPTPPLDQQSRIADYLDRETAQIDTLIAKQESLVSALHERRSATITMAVSNGLQSGRPLMPTGVPQVGSIPTTWSVVRIKAVGESIIGLTYDPDEIVDELDEGTLVVRSGNIQRGRLVHNSDVFVSSRIPARLRIQRGDVIICARNGSPHLIGKNALATSEFVGQTWGAFMVVLRSPLSRYLYWVLNSQIFTAQIGDFSTSTISQLTSHMLNNLKLALPPLAERDEIVARLDAETAKIDALIAKAEQFIALSKERRAALITAAVTGQLDIAA